MTTSKKAQLDGVDPALAQLVRAVQTNTEAEIRELHDLPPRYTRATGMIDPDLDISPLRYEPEKHKEKA